MIGGSKNEQSITRVAAKRREEENDRSFKRESAKELLKE